MKNTALILSSAKLSRVANSFGQHGIENFSELAESLDKFISIDTFSAEQLAKIIDFADSQRQAGFYEGAKARQLHPNNSLIGYDSTTDTCDNPDYDEESDEESDDDSDEELEESDDSNDEFDDSEDLDDEVSYAIYMNDKEGEDYDCPDNVWGDLESATAHAKKVAKGLANEFGCEISVSIDKVSNILADETVDTFVVSPDVKEDKPVSADLFDDKGNNFATITEYKAEDAESRALSNAKVRLNCTDDKYVRIKLTNVSNKKTREFLVCKHPLKDDEVITTEL